jgi:hypothetical protein
MMLDAAEEITKLRAERDAAVRDMRGRAAQRCDEIAQDCMAGSLIDPSVRITKKVARYVAEQIRALPLSVIATERGSK